MTETAVAASTEGQEKALAPYKTIIVALDNDAAGREAAARIAERLKTGRTVRVAYLRE